MVVWLRPQCILVIFTSLHFCFQLVSCKTYEFFWCTTEEGYHQASCPDETALLTDVTIRKVYRRTQSCDPDFHSDYIVHCEEFIDGSSCEGNRTCSFEISSRNYVKCGDKLYPPTYFLVKFTCTQIYTMCTDVTPIRNTLYGYIVSPAYPHPMADNLTCSINIEAGASMYIELAPIQIRLQEAVKCRSEYLEIFGYINPLTNTSNSDDKISNKNSKNIWKSYYTWCGADQSANNPLPTARYLISSNSLYIALNTGVSKKSRYFKIRYKIVPSIVNSQYDTDGVAYDSVSVSSPRSSLTSTTTQSKTIAMPIIQNNSIKHMNGTVTKRTSKKEIIIGIIAGIIVLVVAILVGIGIFIFIKKYRRTTPSAAVTASKPATVPTSKASVTKKVSSQANPKNVPSKSSTKPIDKAPLLEQPISAPSAAAKRKLVPERTVHIVDLNNSRFKSAIGTSATAATGATGKVNNTMHSEAVAASATLSTVKPTLTAADSGIYGADLSDDVPPVAKPLAPVEPLRIYGADLPDKSDPIPPINVVVNPLSEHSVANTAAITNTTTNAATTATITPSTTDTPTAATVSTTDIATAIPSATITGAATSTTVTTSETVTPSNTLLSDDAILNKMSKAREEEAELRFNPLVNQRHFDETVKSAYSHLIDATMSENEGAVGSGSLTSSTSQSRRTSNARQPLSSHETNNIEATRRATQFNPLHMILKKDANKYYTTEYI